MKGHFLPRTILLSWLWSEGDFAMFEKFLGVVRDDGHCNVLSNQD